MPTRADMIAALSRPLADLPDPLAIPVIERPFDVTLHPPGSKSIANRALLLAALADGTSTLTNVPAGADDVRAMIDGLRALGAEIAITPGPHDDPKFPLINATATVRGVAGRWKIPAGQTIRIHAGAAGTTARFLTAAALLAPPGTSVEIDGDPRLRERPIAGLFEALTNAGARCEPLAAAGQLPVRVTPPDRVVGDSLAVDASKTSQFVSALMLVAPFLPHGMHLLPVVPPSVDEHLDVFRAFERAAGTRPLPMLEEFLGDMARESVTPPYLHLSAGVIRRFGVPVEMTSDGEVRVPPASIAGVDFRCATDAGALGYFFGAAALVRGAVLRLPDVGDYEELTQQPEGTFLLTTSMRYAVEPEDRAAVMTFHTRDETRPWSDGHTDARAGPDSVMTAAALSCFAVGSDALRPTTFFGVSNLRHKETDRIEAIRTELGRVGVASLVEPDDDILEVTPPPSGIDCSPSAPPVTFETYNDHRMAMSMALIGLRRPNVSIRNPACVAKSYPTFWRDLARLYA